MSDWIAGAVAGTPFPGSPGSVIAVLAGLGAETVPATPVAAIVAPADTAPRRRPGFARNASV